jgi:hypothetical protein
MTLKQALEFFMVQEERDQLLREKMSVLRNMMIADRIVSLGLLAAGLSHHIRNSMVAVKTFLELAPVKLAEEKGGDQVLRDPEFWREYYQNVQGQIEKITGLLGDLRTASDNSRNQPFDTEIRLRAAVDGAVESWGGGGGGGGRPAEATPAPSRAMIFAMLTLPMFRWTAPDSRSGCLNFSVSTCRTLRTTKMMPASPTLPCNPF